MSDIDGPMFVTHFLPVAASKFVDWGLRGLSKFRNDGRGVILFGRTWNKTSVKLRCHDTHSGHLWLFLGGQRDPFPRNRSWAILFFAKMQNGQTFHFGSNILSVRPPPNLQEWSLSRVLRCSCKSHFLSTAMGLPKP